MKKIYSQAALELILGDIGTRIIEVLARMPADLLTLHVMTGTTVECLNRRIPFLKDIDFILEKGGIFTLKEKGREYLEKQTLLLGN